MENKAHALAAGAFVLLLGALLVVLALWLNRDREGLTRYEVATSESVNGLQEQAPVRFRGVSVGRVASIVLDPARTGEVLVTLEIDPKLPVTGATYATLGYQGVTGLAFIELDHDTALAASPVAQAGRIPLRQGLIARLGTEGMAVLGQAREGGQRLNSLLTEERQRQVFAAVEQMGRAADGVARLSQRMESTLALRVDPALAAVPPLIQEARLTVGTLREAASRADDTAAELGRVTRRVGADGGLIDQMSRTADGVEAAVSEFGSSTAPRINRAADRATQAARQLNRTLDSFAENPQQLLYGAGTAPPGPGEPGFTAPEARP